MGPRVSQPAVRGSAGNKKTKNILKKRRNEIEEKGWLEKIGAARACRKVATESRRTGQEGGGKDSARR